MFDPRRLMCLVCLAAAMLPGVALAQSDAEHQQFLFAYKLLQRGEVDEAGDVVARFSPGVAPEAIAEQLGELLS